MLTEEQRSRLRELSTTPSTVMEMHRKMMERMGGMPAGGSEKSAE